MLNVLQEQHQFLAQRFHLRKYLRASNKTGSTQEVPAYQRTADGEERFVNVRTPFIAYTKTSELAQPCESAFHDPTEPPQTTTVAASPVRNLGLDSIASQFTADLPGIVRLVGHDGLGPSTRPATGGVVRSGPGRR